MSASRKESREVDLRVLYDFEYQTKDDRKISITEGEKLFLIKKTNPDWWQVIRSSKERPFFVPAKYVEESVLDNVTSPDILADNDNVSSHSISSPDILADNGNVSDSAGDRILRDRRKSWAVEELLLELTRSRPQPEPEPDYDNALDADGNHTSCDTDTVSGKHGLSRDNDKIVAGALSRTELRTQLDKTSEEECVVGQSRPRQDSASRGPKGGYRVSLHLACLGGQRVNVNGCNADALNSNAPRQTDIQTEPEYCASDPNLLEPGDFLDAKNPNLQAGVKVFEVNNPNLQAGVKVFEVNNPNLEASVRDSEESGGNVPSRVEPAGAVASVEPTGSYARVASGSEGPRGSRRGPAVTRLSESLERLAQQITFGAPAGGAPGLTHSRSFKSSKELERLRAATAPAAPAAAPRRVALGFRNPAFHRSADNLLAGPGLAGAGAGAVQGRAALGELVSAFEEHGRSGSSASDDAGLEPRRRRRTKKQELEVAAVQVADQHPPATGWTETLDPESGLPCFVHPSGDKWFSSSDAEGRVYFFEENSASSSWSLPLLVPPSPEKPLGKEGWKGSFKEGRKDSLKEGRKDSIKEGRKDSIKEGRKDSIKEGRKDSIKEGRKDSIREGRKDSIKEGRKEDIIIEGRKDSITEGRKGSIMVVRKDSVKEGRKDSMKEGKKDSIKEGKKDSIKEGIEDSLKEGNKDSSKEGMKDSFKEGSKEGVKEGGGKQSLAVIASLLMAERRRSLAPGRAAKTMSMIVPATAFAEEKPAVALPPNWPRLFENNTMRVIREGVLQRTRIVHQGRKVRKAWGAAYVVLTELFLLFFPDQKHAHALLFGAGPGAGPASGGGAPELCLALAGAAVARCDRALSSRKHALCVTPAAAATAAVLVQCDSAHAAECWEHDLRTAVHRLPHVEPAPALSPDAGKKSGAKIQRSKSMKLKGAALREAGSVEDLTAGADERHNKIRDRLRKFFVRRPTREALVKKGIYKDEPMFGRLLADVMPAGCAAPAFVTRCVELIESRRENMEADGLYRVSGNLSQVQRIRLAADQNDLGPLDSEEDVHVITGALKLFFRELKQPLIPCHLFSTALQASTEATRAGRVRQLGALVRQLPAPNRATLRFLLEHLLRVSALSAANRMHVANVAIVFGPTLMWPAEAAPVSMATELMQQNLVVEGLLLNFQAVLA